MRIKNVAWTRFSRPGAAIIEVTKPGRKKRVQATFINRFWYSRSLYFINYLLLPLAWLFGLCIAIRRKLYHFGILPTQHFPVPVIVVGNITVGGTGKTPFVIWLANFLREQGYHPGIVSRGAGGKKQLKPHAVKLSDSADAVGDEAILLAKKTNCPVVIGINRAEAVRYLLETSKCDVVISDDGMQHYRLGRDIEIALIDGERRLGNQCLLPAGPLREPETRLDDVDIVLVKDGNDQDEWSMSITPLQLVSLKQHKVTHPLTEFSNKKVHAVAGIGNPEKFFTMLKQAGIEIVPHVFPDHYIFQANDLKFDDALPIVMTEKDAVKCVAFASEQCWYVDIAVNIDEALRQKLLTLLLRARRSET